MFSLRGSTWVWTSHAKESKKRTIWERIRATAGDGFSGCSACGCSFARRSQQVTPYYEQDGITIYHGDCREVLPSLGVVAIVSDPPYGVSLRNGDVDGHRSNRWDSIAGDEDGSVGEWAINHARSIAAPVVAVFASPWKPWPGRWRNQIVWDKGGAVGGGGDIATCLKRSWELLQVWNADPFRGPRAESVWRYPIMPADTELHIAAKPVALMVRVIDTFVGARAVIDPFAGSGSTLIAARLLGVSATGIEIDERYCEIAAQRLSQGALPMGYSA
jgi:hypothetical protein